MAQHIRRNPRKLPSVKKHGFSAFILLGIIIFSTLIWLNLSAKNKPVTYANTDITLPKRDVVLIPEPPARLPDLLEPDNIPDDVNPTEQINMVGGPKSGQNPGAPKATIPVINGRAVPTGQRTITNFTPLARAPIDGLSRMTPYGPIPHPHQDGRKAVDAYAKTFTPKAKTKYVSLVVGGLGLNPILTRKAINELPGAVTLSFAADAPGLQGWVNKARAHGHEVMLELPMQGSEPVGIRTLTTAGPKQANIKNLEYLLSRAQGYFAVTNYDGARLVNDETALLPIVKLLKDAGVGFVYDGALENPRIEPLAKREDLALISASSYLDEEKQDSIYVQRNIQVLVEDSYDNVPIGMGFSYIGTIDGIKNWLETKPKNIELAPVSYTLKKR